MDKKKASPWKSVQLGIAILVVMIVYAYGFQVTKVNLQELSSEQRQSSLARVLRTLAKPDIIEFEKEEQVEYTPVYLPCTEQIPATIIPEEDSVPTITIDPICGSPDGIITVTGNNLYPNASGSVRFVPGNDPENPVALSGTDVSTDPNGRFSVAYKLPKRPSEDVQYIRATIRRSIGLPYFSQTAKDTWEKIIETVFLALLATTAGTLIAIPLSFMAARNLMKSVRSPLSNVALSIIGWPVGFYLGFMGVKKIGEISTIIPIALWVITLTILLLPVLIWLVARWALPQEELGPVSKQKRVLRLLILLLAFSAGILWMYQLALWVKTIGAMIQATYIGFIGNFLFQISEMLRILLPILGALVVGGLLSSYLGKVGQLASEKLADSSAKILNLFLSLVAGALILSLLGFLVEIIYQVGKPLYSIWIPGVVGGVLGLILAFLSKPKEQLPIGLIVYSITRTFLNGLRSVEALVMAIVFVIAVGIGPFAGVLALGLHTIVSLAKLYSEQVESILPGPLEAIEATGANRLQTIIYAVVPQIVPPYISYTMYRWDINVRMSTIIGFVGGGGIGFLLQQNINLLNYRAASTQMLAIAVVVASMDYLSSYLREKVV